MSKKKKTIEELLEEALVPKEEQKYKELENWRWVYLGAITQMTDFVANGSFQSLKENVTVYEKEEYAYYVRLVDIRKGLGHPEQKYVDYKSYSFLAKSFLKGGELLVANIGANVGEVFIMPKVDRPATIAPNMIVLRVYNTINNKYLYYFLSSSLGRNILYTIVSGTGQPKLNKTQLKRVPILLPSLNEQKRIAEKVERLLSKIDEAKQLIKEAKETFELRRAAILDKAFRGELTGKWREENQYDKLEPIEQAGNIGPYKLPNGWEWKKLGEIGELQRGKSKHRPRNDPKLFGGEYPFIQTGDVARASDYVEDFSQTLSEFGYNQSKLFPIGTVCITIAANIADTAILKFPCCFPDSVVGFVPFEESMSSEFVHYYINTIKNDLEHYAPATAQKNINLKILNEVLVPVPPLVEHNVIMEEIKGLLGKEYEANQYLVLENSVALIKQSILSKAFRGELGTNDPSEENAIELLKGVLQEQVK
jgi:type I restriction enzyme S subunit